VQVFKYQLGTQFRVHAPSLPHAQPLPVLRFDHLPPSASICALKHAPESAGDSLRLKFLLLDLENWGLFKVMITARRP
jgi:hypothetical protein